MILDLASKELRWGKIDTSAIPGRGGVWDSLAYPYSSVDWNSNKKNDVEDGRPRSAQFDQQERVLCSNHKLTSQHDITNEVPEYAILCGDGSQCCY